MYMTLYNNRSAHDASIERGEPGHNTTIPEGRHEVERIPNPYRHNGSHGDWIVLKGTLIGATEESWREWVRNPNERKYIEDDMVVAIEE
jgi:hypothetical protein